MGRAGASWRGPEGQARGVLGVLARHAAGGQLVGVVGGARLGLVGVPIEVLCPPHVVCANPTHSGCETFSLHCSLLAGVVIEADESSRSAYWEPE